MRLAMTVLRRQLTTDRWAVLLLVVLVAGGALLAVGAPSLRADVRERGLLAALATAPPASRDVLAATSVPVVSGPDADPAAPYDRLVASVADVAAGPIEAVRPPGGPPLAGDPWWSLTTKRWQAEIPGPRIGPRRWLFLRASAQWQRHVRIVEGRLPGSATPADPPDVLDAGAAGRVPAVVEIVLSRRALELTKLEVGDVFEAEPLLGEFDAPRIAFRLVGAFEPRSATDLFWNNDAMALSPQYGYTDRLGVFYTGVAFTSPASLPVLAEELSLGTVTTTVRFSVDPVVAAQVDPSRLVTAVRRATSRAAVPGDDGPTAGFVFAPTSQVDELVLDHLRARRPVDALSGLLLTTLLAAAGIVLLLAARLLLERRREAVVLAQARGASGRQVLGVLTVEALVLGVPAAAVGGVLASLLPGSPGISGAVLLGLVALAPAVAVVVAAVPLVRRGRGPAEGARIGGRGGAAAPSRRARLARQAPTVVLVLLVSLAAVAVLALRRRGLDVAANGGATLDAQSAAGLDRVPESGLDPLVVAAPTLLAAVVAVLAARALAAPVALAARLVTRRRGAVGFLGLARAQRESGGLLPLVCLGLCLAVAVLAVVTSRTTQAATESSATQAVAAPLRLHSIGFPEESLAELEGMPGVRAAARLTEIDDAAFTPPSRDGSTPQERIVRVYGTDPVALARVQGGLRGVPVLSTAVAARLEPAGPTGPLPVAVGPVTARSAPVGSTVSLRVGARRIEVVVAAVATDGLVGMPRDGSWMLGSLPGLRDRTKLVLSPQDLLADAAPVPDDDTVRGFVPDAVTVRTPAETAARYTDSPLAVAVREALPVTLVVGSLLAAAAVLLALLLGARARSRFIAHLRALGLAGRQASALVGLEVAPVAAGAVLGGGVGGLLLARLVLPVADLRPLTGAVVPPPVLVPVWPVVAIVVGLGVVVALGVLGAVLAGRSVSPAQAARTVEGG